MMSLSTKNPNKTGIDQYVANPWFREEFDENLQENTLVFYNNKTFFEFQSFLKQELDKIPLSKPERDYYRHNIIDFVTEQVPILNLAPKQAFFLKCMEDFSIKKFALLTPRGGSKTMLDALIALWSCEVVDKYWQTILGGSFDQTKALSKQTSLMIYANPRLALTLQRAPTKEEINFKNESFMLSLKASERSARSPHPSGLMLDEYVLITQDIVKAARGQLAETMFGFYRHGRLIITSTAQQGDSVKEFKGLFDKGWDRIEKESPPKNWNFFHTFNWSLLDCTWRTEEEMQTLEETKMSVTQEEWDTEYLGLFGVLTGSILNEHDINYAVENARLPEYEYKSPQYPCYMGIDWGFAVNPTVIILVQKQSDGIIRVLEMEAGLKVDFDYWLEEIEEMCKKYKVVGINADANNIGDNLRLKKRGLPINPISFGSTTEYVVGGKVKKDTFKDIMVNNLQYLSQQHMFEVHYQFDDLISEMRNYMWDHKKSEQGQKKPIKTGVDHVEALQLAIIDLGATQGYKTVAMSSVVGRTLISDGNIKRISDTYDARFKDDESHISASVFNRRGKRRF